ncbi:MAG: pyrroline-5-carboxylate reductase [Pseudomonadota bacterium]
MKNSHIAFIGGGNMAASLIGGLLETDVAADHIHVADVAPEPVAARYPVNLYKNNADAAKQADVIVLAVKPQQMGEVAKGLKSTLENRDAMPLFISIAAGIRLCDLYAWLGSPTVPAVRVMPNTPALVQTGASGLYADVHVSATQREMAESILQAVGITAWVEREDLLDTVTALSGSGPAYFFLVMEVMQKAAEQLGLSANEARQLTLQTALGAAKMALNSEDDPATLRANVTSKGGTTERALEVMQAGGIEQLFLDALSAAKDRSVSLAEELGEN